MTISNLGYLIQDARKEQQLPVENLATLTGLSEGTIRAIEQGRRCPSQQAMRRIADVLGLDVSAYIDELVPFAGGRRRRPITPDLDENILRLMVVELVMHADIGKLRALASLLKEN